MLDEDTQMSRKELALAGIVMSVQEYLIESVKEATNPYSKKLLQLLSLCLDGNSEKKINKVFREALELAEEKYREILQDTGSVFVFQNEFLRPIMEEEDNIAQVLVRSYAKNTRMVLRGSEITAFRVLHLYGLGSECDEAMRDQERPLPANVRRAYKNWAARNQGFIAECRAINLLSAEPEILPEAKIPTESRITYIDVYYPLVTQGNIEESMGYAPPPASAGENADRPCLDANLNRTEKLAAALLASDESSIKHITVRRDRRTEFHEDEKGKPYHLIDLEMTDGSRSRIAVCDYHGHITFVMRDAPEMSEHEVVTISNLRKNPKVWTAMHVSDTQFIGRVQEILYTPLDDLVPELKHRNYWHSLRGVLTQSFMAAVMDTGKIPSSLDTSAIEHGPLREETTWRRAYQALFYGRVDGISEGTTFKKLFQSLAQDIPCLRDFLGRPALQAEEIDDACRKFAEQFGLAVQKDFFDEFTVSGRCGQAVNLALAFGAVRGWDKFPELQGNPPRDLEDFVIKTGQAVRDGNSLVLQEIVGP